METTSMETVKPRPVRAKLHVGKKGLSFKIRLEVTFNNGASVFYSDVASGSGAPFALAALLFYNKRLRKALLRDILYHTKHINELYISLSFFPAARCLYGSGHYGFTEDTVRVNNKQYPFPILHALLRATGFAVSGTGILMQETSSKIVFQNTRDVLESIVLSYQGLIF